VIADRGLIPDSRSLAERFAPEFVRPPFASDLGLRELPSLGLTQSASGRELGENDSVVPATAPAARSVHGCAQNEDRRRFAHR
jgi:hypothetical protein